ncbi:hypothetical protein R8510_05001 [Ralstonia chuxiongensis]|nr:hypothetical protein R8510_05001 [Ralstonia chuxiongensis]
MLTLDGQWHKPLLLCIMDDHSRLVCHLQWFLDETTVSLVHGVSQAVMIADEFVEGLASLGILHQTTLPYSPYQYVALKFMCSIGTHTVVWTGLVSIWAT